MTEPVDHIRKFYCHCRDRLPAECVEGEEYHTQAVAYYHLANDGE